MHLRKSCLALALVILLISACRRNPEIESFTGFAQGTTYSMVYEDIINISPEELRKQVDDILQRFDMSLSLYKDSSIISRINRNEDVRPDRYFIEAFHRSQEISEITGGAFDLTVGPLVKAWGFGPDEKPDFSESKIDSLRGLVGMDKVWIEDGRLMKEDPGVRLDFNAIAQGYSVDVICSHFDSLGLANYLVEIGGEVRAKGTKSGARWRIGIDKPEEGNFSPGEDLEAIIGISDEALATSGNYRKFYEKDGVKYSHTINPISGYPARNNLLSATVLASDCATADGIATACMVMGIEKAREFIENNPSLLAFFVYSDEKGSYQTWASSGLLGRMEQPGY